MNGDSISLNVRPDRAEPVVAAMLEIILFYNGIINNNNCN